ncbi:hypothetical protein TNCV_1494031 [Trichonephila clavipes]|nr:hypothetical protein TNCV_1494031 [Trichonephila clavipes]
MCAAIQRDACPDHQASAIWSSVFTFITAHYKVTRELCYPGSGNSEPLSSDEDDTNVAIVVAIAPVCRSQNEAHEIHCGKQGARSTPVVGLGQRSV